jgi:D-sedoheptulose 7-phosphate isomerase
MKSWNSYIKATGVIGESIDELALMTFAQELSAQIRSGKPILTAGNGGSATTADHFAADLFLMYKRTGKSCKSLCLNSHLGLNTALNNDLGFELSLAHQIESYLDEDPLIITFSASGNSPNLLNLLKKANSEGLKIWSFVGFDGGSTLKFAGSRIIHSPSPLGEYGQVENVQLSICHFLVDSLVQEFSL